MKSFTIELEVNERYEKLYRYVVVAKNKAEARELAKAEHAEEVLPYDGCIARSEEATLEYESEIISVS